jgi:ATP-dependent HslUV protease ATP-binding subunit HslU
MEHGMDGLTPAAIVAELDKYIVGQREAKRAVAVALRSRIRRGQLPDDLRDEVSPKNILMIGPTGVGKTEIARRVARLVDAPFIKVEATRFTEVGFVGRDVESIIRDLVEVSIDQVDERQFEQVRPEAEQAAIERIASYLLQQREGIVPPRRSAARRGGGRRGASSPAAAGEPTAGPSAETRRQQHQRILAQLQEKQLEAETVEIEVEIAPPDPYDFPDPDGMEQVEPDGRGRRRPEFRGPTHRSRRVSVAEARRILTDQEADRLIDWDTVLDEAVRRVEEGGIVFLDEVDKIVGGGGDLGPSVSDEGVQRDLLPIVEGATVMTRYGPVKTDHILFIGAGAFNGVKPSDLIPEFQGRFPLRVELTPLGEDDLYAILTEPANSLVRQYTALLATEQVTLAFADDALHEIAALATALNERQEDIGARRLATIMEQTLEEISFDAPTRSGETITIDAAFVRERLGDLAEDEDLSNYIL